MIPRSSWVSGRPGSKPRASGDDPGTVTVWDGAKEVNPARAGMIRGLGKALGSGLSKPRASGDDPAAAAKRRARAAVNPARAGMILTDHNL